MARLSDAIDALIERLESFRPARDPQVLYQHFALWPADPPDRAFRFLSRASWALPDINDGTSNTEAMITLETAREMNRDGADRLRMLGDDAEELFQRLSYRPGNEWAKSSGFDFVVEKMEAIDAGGSASRLRLEIAVIYNMG